MGSIVEFAALGAAFGALVTYGIRAGVQMVDDTWPDRAMRGFLVATLLFLVVAFADVARSQDGLIWRQWPVALCLFGVAVAAAWPRR